MTAESLPSPHEPSGGLLLSLRGISKSFGAVAALTDVDLDVSAGQVVALVGDNGAGKSTLVKVLSGVHQPDAGTVGFDHGTVSIPSPATAQRLGIATVFQDLALCENLNVVENLFLGRELRGLRLDEVAMEVRSLALLGELSAKIPSVRAPVAALSGGQRQTVAIARTLLGDPKVIILDEPTAALGVAQTAEVLNLIERLRERGLGVIMVSHNMADVRAVADTVAVLRLGRNNGVFDAAEATAADLVAAITGATDNVVSRRAGRERARDDRAGRGTDGRHAGGRAADDLVFGDRAMTERAADSGTESAHQGDAS
ncbi:ATP-binding cassette domain-containing protein [Streptomyces globisporus]|uniref:ATP-binding cassette domain-containing protein n=1 Tax=Streptomyces globisporus TaxID=1908 RepID=UPI0037B1D1C8